MKQQQQKEHTLHDIIEQTFDFSEHSEQEKNDMIADTAGLIMEASLLKALGNGGEKVQEDFDTFMGTDPSDVDLNTYVQTKIPNFQNYLMEELKALKDADLEKVSEESEK